MPHSQILDYLPFYFYIIDMTIRCFFAEAFITVDLYCFFSADIRVWPIRNIPV